MGEIASRIEAGEPPGKKPGEIAPIDLIAALAACALGDDRSPGPGLVQGKPRHPRLLQKLSEPVLAVLFPGAPQRARLTLSAGLLQVHDFWDASHSAAQRADDIGERDFSAFWHGIAHRREPDADNAAYWFRRVGRHPIFAPLALEVRPYFDQEGLPSLSELIAPRSEWNPGAMIELCTGARAGTSQERLARRLQRTEMWLLLEASFGAM